MSETLAKVYRIFDPAPLLAKDVDLYVNLDEVRGGEGIVNKLDRTIRLSDRATCQLLAGHRGSGKSTELRRLQRSLETGDHRAFVVFCKADDDIDRNDVDFPDVLIAIVRQMAVQLRERAEIKLKPGYFKDRWERVKHLLGPDVSFEKLTLDAGLLKIAGAIKGSPEAREKIRQSLEPDTTNWLDAANDVISKATLELVKKKYAGLVIIVDDLDKMVLRPHPKTDRSTGEYLFINRERQLTALKCHLVYTIPLALAYSGAEQTIAKLYGGHPPVIPMNKVRERPPDDSRFRPGIEKLGEVIAARLAKVGVGESHVFKDDTVRDRLIRLSGGQPRELMLLVREAIVGGDLPIDETAVNRATREGRRAYARQLRDEQRPIIEEVQKTGTFTRTRENDQAIRDLLDSRALLQYRNDDEWYDLNPLMDGLGEIPWKRVAPVSNRCSGPVRSCSHPGFVRRN